MDKTPVLILAPLPDFLMQPLLAAHVCHDYFHASDKAALLAQVGAEIRGIVMAGGSVSPVLQYSSARSPGVVVVAWSV